MTAENSPNVEKEAVIQVQEVQRVPQRPNQRGKHTKTHHNQMDIPGTAAPVSDPS